MKTRITAVAFILLTVLAITAYAQQYDPESDFKAELMEGGNSVKIVGYRGEKWTVRIPPKIQDIPVTHIGKNAFEEKNITSVIIPESVTSIEGDAFRLCTSLISVTIPNSVISIGNYTFTRCTKLTSVSIPNSVTYIGNFSFSGCNSLTSVIIPNSVTEIGYGAFDECTRLTAITVTSDNRTYTAVNGILYNKDKSVLHTYPAGKKGSFIIPNGVTTIENSAFSYCASLISVTIPNSVTSIGSGAFWNCTSLSSLTIPNSVTIIKDAAFAGCSNLNKVTIPNSITTIGRIAFARCTNLNSIIIPNSVASIEDEAFYGTRLTSVTFQGRITSDNFAENAFEGDLRQVFYAVNQNGTPGTYRTTNPGENAEWTKI